MGEIKVNQGEMNRAPSPMTDSNVQRYGSADADDINVFDAIMNGGTASEQVEGTFKKATKDKGDSASDAMSSDHEEVVRLFGGSSLTTDKLTIETFESVMNSGVVSEQVAGVTKKLTKESNDSASELIKSDIGEEIKGHASESVHLVTDRSNTGAIKSAIKNDSVSEHVENISEKQSDHEEVISSHLLGGASVTTDESTIGTLASVMKSGIGSEQVEGVTKKLVKEGNDSASELIKSDIGEEVDLAFSVQETKVLQSDDIKEVPISGSESQADFMLDGNGATVGSSEVKNHASISEEEFNGAIIPENKVTPESKVTPENKVVPEVSKSNNASIKNEEIAPQHQDIKNPKTAIKQEPETLTIGQEEIVIQPEEIVSNYAEQVLSNLTSLSDSRMVVAADRISNIGTAIIERLMVTEAALAAKQEVTIVFKENILPGTQVSITRDGTALSLSFVSVNPNSLEFLQAGQESLRNFLMDRVDRVSNVHIKFEGQHEANDLAQPRQQRRQQQDEPSHEER